MNTFAAVTGEKICVCMVCGFAARVRTESLLQNCQGKPTQWGEKVLKSLRVRGRHPAYPELLFETARVELTRAALANEERLN